MREEARYPYVHVDVAPPEVEDVSAELFELGALGVEERDATTLARASEGNVTLVASFADEPTAQNALRAVQGRFSANVEYVIGDAWREGWRAYFKPTRVGERLVVRPSWEPFSPEPADVVLVIDPGQAFGTGTHETTRLVLRELDGTARAGVRVLDVGCGSGILSIACLLLGARVARAIDVDEDAIRNAVENATTNGVVDRFEADTTSIADVSDRYDLVVANIERRVLVPLAGEIVRCVAPGGILLLSGILAGEEGIVAEAYRSLGSPRISRDGEWVCLRYEAAGG